MSDDFPRTYPDALRVCADANELRGDVVRAAELRERAAAAEAARPPSGPIATLTAGERPRSEAEAILDRSLSILRDARGLLLSAKWEQRGELISRIDALAKQVDTWKAGR